MRVIAKSDQLEVFAIAGSRCILIAFNLPKAASKGLKGFAVKRGVGNQNGRYLVGKKVFKSVVPAPDPNDDFSSEDHPIQSFLWSNYVADPDTEYSFVVEARYGDPGKLETRETVEFKIRTESEAEGVHRVFFNRGAIASQAFAETFGNKKLSAEERNDVTNKETKWLSRKLLEACLAFIRDTRKGQALRVAAYEFTYEPVLLELRDAIQRGVDVQIVYGSADENDKAIKAAKLPRKAGGSKILYERTRAKIPHNKFMVRLVGDEPKIVWTGSTNFTSSGFLGQTNTGHIVEDDGVAAQYLAYWKLLTGDPERGEAREQAMDITPNPSTVIEKSVGTCVFSPRSTAGMREWYAQRIRNARNCVLFTGAFGIDEVLLEAIGTEGPALRFVLLEKPPSEKIREAVTNNPGDILLSHGAVLGKRTGRNLEGKKTEKRTPEAKFKVEEWFLKEDLERRSNEGFVFFVHAKFLLIDPLSDDPLVCTGSANFSDESLLQNDENMLLIRGDTAVADVYLTEFDRIFRHFYFRDIANRSTDDDPAKFLDEDDRWWRDYYTPSKVKCRRREMFFETGKQTWASLAKKDPDPFA